MGAPARGVPSAPAGVPPSGLAVASAESGPGDTIGRGEQTDRQGSVLSGREILRSGGRHRTVTSSCRCGGRCCPWLMRLRGRICP